MRKILLVEKSALWREKIGNWLREEGYYLIAVRDRDLAINCLEKEEIDIILVEEKVLREDSFSLLSFIRQSFPDVVIIALERVVILFLSRSYFLREYMIIFLLLLLLLVFSR